MTINIKEVKNIKGNSQYTEIFILLNIMELSLKHSDSILLCSDCRKLNSLGENNGDKN